MTHSPRLPTNYDDFLLPRQRHYDAYYGILTDDHGHDEMTGDERDEVPATTTTTNG